MYTLKPLLSYLGSYYEWHWQWKITFLTLAMFDQRMYLSVTLYNNRFV